VWDSPVHSDTVREPLELPLPAAALHNAEMPLLATALVAWFAVSAADVTPIVVQAPDSPVRLDHAKVFNVGAGEPAVLMYAATNLTENDLEQFTVIAFIFDGEGNLRARQAAPGRRTLEKRATKYSTMVLDVRPLTPTDRIVIGVDQAQRTESDKWWSAQLEEPAKAAVKQ
jgi:hypothetical protein